MPWVWYASARANIRAIWFRDTENPRDSRNCNPNKRGLNLCTVYFLVKPIRHVRSSPSPLRCMMSAQGLTATALGFYAVRRYAVHDAVDFHRAGLIPLDRLTSQKDDSERQRFFDEVFDRHKRAHIPLRYERALLEQAFTEIIHYFPNLGPYKGTIRQRANLINHSAVLIKRYVEGVSLNRRAPRGKEFIIDPEFEKEVFMLKQLTWSYVILDSRLATQQHGQRRIIRDLFEAYSKEATEGNDLTVFPIGIREQLEKLASQEARIRAVSDYVSGMGEKQAILIHRKLTGVSFGSILDGGTE